MQIAINTNALNTNTPQALQQAHQLGFRSVEINLQPAELNYGYQRKVSSRFYRQLKKQIDELGLSVWSTTSCPLNQTQMFFERARKDILVGGAAAAGILGSRVYVVQPADIYTSEMAFHSYLRDNLAPPTIEGYDEAWVQAANRHIATAILNTDYWTGIPLTNQVDRMTHITEHLGIGWAMDIRAALHRNNLDNWLERVGKRLAVAYLYDWDEDGIPTLPLADDWANILPKLAQTPLKTIVIHSQTLQTPEAIAQSYTHIQQIIT